jgi:hypothetical protein
MFSKQALEAILIDDSKHQDALTALVAFVE